MACLDDTEDIYSQVNDCFQSSHFESHGWALCNGFDLYMFDRYYRYSDGYYPNAIERDVIDYGHVFDHLDLILKANKNLSLPLIYEFIWQFKFCKIYDVTTSCRQKALLLQLQKCCIKEDCEVHILVETEHVKYREIYESWVKGHINKLHDTEMSIELQVFREIPDLWKTLTVFPQNIIHVEKAQDISSEESKRLCNMKRIAFCGAEEKIMANHIVNGDLESLGISDTLIGSMDLLTSKLTHHKHLKSLTIKNVMTDSIKSVQRLKQLTQLHLEGLQTSTFSKSLFSLENLESLCIIACQLECLRDEAFDKMTKLTFLDLSHNGLTSLPLSLDSLQQLEVLKLNNNCLGDLGHIKALTKLKELNMDSNLLLELPEDISDLLNLETLSLCNNKLENIPMTISVLQQLKSLYLDSNRLNSFPTEVTMLTKLRNLHLKGNEIRKIPPSIKVMKSLEKLDLSDSGISVFPEEVSHCHKLKKLDLDNNAIEDLPETVKNMDSLEELRISDNKLTSFPKVLVQMKSLKFLSIKDNEIKEIPPSIKEIKSLEYIDLENTGISVLPGEISHCHKLRKLIVHRNAIEDLPETMKDMDALEELIVSHNKLTSFPKVSVQMKSLKSLSLWNNGIKEIPTSIKTMKSLNYLELSGTRISVLPEEISQCHKLRKLRLHGNAIEYLPETMKDLNALEELLISRNKLSSFPTVLLKMTSLKSLSLWSNKIKEIPPSIKEMKSLEELDLEITGISVFPTEILHCYKLKKLDFDNNAIEDLPQSMKDMNDLGDIRIRNNKLTSFPKVLVQMKSLKLVSIGRNEIKDIPPSIKEMKSLECLEISDNGISTFPAEIAHCHKLKKLDIHNNGIKDLPETMKEMDALEKLGINGNKLTSFPKVLMQMKSLKSLSLRQNGIKEIPTAIREMKSLEHLDLCDNRISVFPAEISHCHKLKKLDIHNNAIEDLPETMKDMDALEELRIGENKLSSFPKVLMQMTALKSLSIKDNGIKEIPSSIKEMKSLEELYLGKTGISILPAEIGFLVALQRISIASNSICSLPLSLKFLTKLYSFDASSNDIRVIPDIFEDMPHIKTFNVDIRNIDYPPQSICREGVKAIAQFYNDYRGDSIFKSSREKINFIGETMAGKTSLAHCLSADMPGYVEQEANRTQVLQTMLWKPEENVEFQINDFGGHDIYKIIYHIFQTEKSTNLFIYDLAKYKERDFQNCIGFYLDRLFASCPDTADVFFVGTKTDEIEQDGEITKKQQSVEDLVNTRKSTILKSHDLQIKNLKKTSQQDDQRKKDNAPNCREPHMSKITRLKKLKSGLMKMRFHFHSLSCKTGQGLKDIHESLCHIGKSSRTQTPESWQDVMTSLQKYCKETENVSVDVEELFQDIYTQSDVIDTSSFEWRQFTNVLSHLHYCGELLWHSSLQSLRDVVFPNVQKLIDVLKTILHHDVLGHLSGVRALYRSTSSYEHDVDTWRRCGQMSERLLERLLISKGVKTLSVDTVKSLLIQFNICYAFEPKGSINKASLLMPWFLKENKPLVVEDKWEDVQSEGELHYNVTITFKFSDYIPETFFERMVVLSASTTASHCPEVYIWRDGFYCKVNVVKLLLEAITINYTNEAVAAVNEERDSLVRICNEIQLHARGNNILDVWDVVFPLLEKISMYIQDEWPGICYDAELLCPHCIQYNITPCEVIPEEFFVSMCPRMMNVLHCNGMEIPAVVARPVNKEHCSQGQVRQLELYEDKWKQRKYENGPLTNEVIEWVADKIDYDSYWELATFLDVPYERKQKLREENPKDTDIQIIKALIYFRKKSIDNGKTNKECMEHLMTALDECNFTLFREDLEQKLGTEHYDP